MKRKATAPCDEPSCDEVELALQALGIPPRCPQAAELAAQISATLRKKTRLEPDNLAAVSEPNIQKEEQ